MPRYELMYLLGSHVAENDAPTLQAEVLKAVQEFAGAEVQETALGKKKLAYPIGKTRNGYYIVVNFTMDASNINKLNAKIRTMDSNIIRHLLINLDEHLMRLSKDKILQEKLSKRPEAEKPAPKTKPEPMKAPVIKLEDIDEKLLDEKIEKALSEDLTK